MNFSKLGIYSIGLLSIIISSCNKDYFDSDKLNAAIDDIVWSPEFAIPLVYASYDLDNVLNTTSENAQSVVSIDDDNFITLIYRGEIASLEATEVFSFPDQNFNSTINAGVSLPFLPANDSIIIPFSNTQPFNALGSNQLDSILLNGGSLNVNYSSTFQHDLRIELTIESIVKNQQLYSDVVNLSYNGSTPVTAQESFDLSEALLDLTNNGNASNTLRINLRVTVIGSGNPVNSNDELSVDFGINEISFSAIYGYIDVSGISTAVDSVPVTVFSSAQGMGTFSIADPSVKFIFENSVGVPIDVSFNALKGVNTNINSEVDLINSQTIPSPLPVQSPSLNQIGQILVDSFSISGPDMASFVNNQPNYLLYGINAQTASNAGQSNFVLDSSRFKVSTELSLPLEGAANIFAINDTIPISLDLENEEDSSSVELVSLTLKTIIENEFPIDFGIQVYTLDSLSQITDSILPGGTVIPSAQVNTQGDVLSKGTLNLDAIFESSEVQNIQNMKFVRIKASATTAGGGTQNVKIYSDYLFNLQMGVKSKITTTL